MNQERHAEPGTEVRGGETILTVQRGMRVLRAFRSCRAPLSNTEIVRRTGLSKATVSRLTSTLMQLGFLRHVPDGREFELGMGALGMGHAYLVGSRLAGRANPVLRDLADRLDVSVALSVRDGLDMLYLAYCASQKVATLRLGAGMLLPMGVTAAGHAYLWGQPLAERQALLLHLERGAADPARVRRSVDASFLMLDEVGVCLVAGEYQRDVYAVAVPVIVGSDRALMALSCGKAQAQADLEAERRRIAPALREASAQLELALADFDGPP